jgi:hypothetical protein
VGVFVDEKFDVRSLSVTEPNLVGMHMGSDEGQTYALYFVLLLLNCVAKDSTILSASGRSARRR